MALIGKISALTYRAIFNTAAWVRPPTAHPIELTPTSRVLCFTCAGIGDTLTDSVVFKALRETFMGMHIAAVVHHRRRVLVEHNPYVDQIFQFQKSPIAVWHLSGELMEAGPWDAILHLRGNDPEPRCLSYMVNADVAVSVPNMTRLGHLCGHQVLQPDWDETHGVEQTLRIARYIGADTPKPQLVYQVRPEERKLLEEKVRRLVITSRPRLVLQMGGGRRASWRDWPVKRYAELIQLVVANDLNVEIFVLGGADQEERCHELDNYFSSHEKPYHNLVNKLSLAESAALLASAWALVSTDTGIMHLGFAVGTRVVALIHCNNPANRVGPRGYGDRHRVIQLKRPSKYQTPEDASMADIPAQTVLLQLQQLASSP